MILSYHGVYFINGIVIPSVDGWKRKKGSNELN